MNQREPIPEGESSKKYAETPVGSLPTGVSFVPFCPFPGLSAFYPRMGQRMGQRSAPYADPDCFEGKVEEKRDFLGCFGAKHPIFLRKSGVSGRVVQKRCQAPKLIKHTRILRWRIMKHTQSFYSTVASVLIANGTDVVTVSKQLGHLDVSTTETFYSHIIEENKQKATDCLADALLRKKQA